MAFWEFLLQKEGDRSWLPLESSKVEVLEGRYRIVAHSSQPNMAIEIRIIHDATAEMPPIRRTQKRFSRTNQNGLVVIMPFTRLLPGVWELRCTSDLLAEMLGEGWQRTIRLQVLPLEIEIGDEWNPDWPPEVTGIEGTNAEVTNASGIAANITHQDLSDHPEADRLDILPAFEHAGSEGTASDLLPLSAPTVSTPPASLSIPAAQPASNTSVRLQLGQDTYVIQTGQPLTLMGQVEAIDGQSGDRSFPLEALQVRLYDPRTSQILIEERQPLTARTLPFPFTCRITLPDHFQTYLVLGEIVLYGTTSIGESVALVMQPFSVTTDLHELLEAIANDFSEVDVPLPAHIDNRTGHDSNAASLEPLNAVAPVQFRPSPQQPLPPQLRPADPGKTWQSLDLPSFHEAEAESLTEPLLDETVPFSLDTTNSELAADLAALSEVSQPISNEGSSDESLRADLSTDSTKEMAEAASGLDAVLSASASEPLFDVPIAGSSIFDNDAPIPDWDKAEPRSLLQPPKPSPQTPKDKPDSPEDAAFRLLNLQERFWTRLQALVADRELSEWLSTFDDGEFNKPNGVSRRSTERDAALTSHEVVVEDELANALENQALSEFAQEQPGVPVLSIQQPLPVPQLDITGEELTAGQLLPVQVNLPDLDYPLFVKLWLVDRQNRSVLDGPYWLTDFAPSGFGDLVCRYELTVPHGCLELQFEAIAIEMTTQRESDKATVTRQVVPANLSSLSLDELDV